MPHWEVLHGTLSCSQASTCSLNIDSQRPEGYRLALSNLTFPSPESNYRLDLSERSSEVTICRYRPEQKVRGQAKVSGMNEFCDVTANNIADPAHCTLHVHLYKIS